MNLTLEVFYIWIERKNDPIMVFHVAGKEGFGN